MNSQAVASFQKFAFVLALFLIAVSPLAAEEAYFAKDVTEDMDIPDVVARVNDLEIDSKYLKFELNRLLRNRNKPLSLLKRQRLASDILDREINRELIYVEGVKQNMTATPEEIDKVHTKEMGIPHVWSNVEGQILCLAKGGSRGGNVDSV